MSETKQGTNLTQAREEISALEGVIAVSQPYEDSFFGYIIAVQILPECSPTLASRIPSQMQGIPVKINPALQLIENALRQSLSQMQHQLAAMLQGVCIAEQLIHQYEDLSTQCQSVGQLIQEQQRLYQEYHERYPQKKGG